MKCSNPFVNIFMRDGTRRVVRVRCRHCTACRITDREQWTCRIKGELQTRASKGAFVTLTYNEDTVPKNDNGDMNLVKADVQKFFKRLRIYIQRHYPNMDCHFKYYCVGEYGEESSKIGKGRPHFHFILTGISYWDSNFRKAVNACWTYGFNKILPANPSTIRYVLKYMDKSWFEKQAVIESGRNPPFSVKSLGIGSSYMIKNWKNLVDDKGFRSKKSHIGVPPYWIKKLALPSKDMSTSASIYPPLAVESKKHLQMFLNSPFEHSPYGYEKYLASLGRQQEYILKSAYNVGKDR